MQYILAIYQGKTDMIDSANNVLVGIVEDELCLTEIYRNIFSRRGIAISFVARDGTQAIEYFRAADPRPRVIIMDQRMPEKNGVDATKEIREIDPDVKIIFVSADSDVEEEALEAGAIGFIKKPASLQSITDAVRKA
jgi:DNA-binding NarL/FixJ family response regulator